MDSIEKEARIRLCMENLKKEEENNKNLRIKQEKEILDKKENDEIIRISKSILYKENIDKYIKDKNWYKIIEQLNECFYEENYFKRIVSNDYSHYDTMNRRIGDMITKEISFSGYSDSYRIIVKQSGGICLFKIDEYDKYQNTRYPLLVSLGEELENYNFIRKTKKFEAFRHLIICIRNFLERNGTKEYYFRDTY